jgi:hypothetical protein
MQGLVFAVLRCAVEVDYGSIETVAKTLAPF